MILLCGKVAFARISLEATCGGRRKPAFAYLQVSLVYEYQLFILEERRFCMNLRTAQSLGMQLVIPGQLARLLPGTTGVGAIPFEESAMRDRVDSHVLVPIFPVSIMEIVQSKICEPLAKFLERRGAWWYQEQSLRSLCAEPMEARWVLVSRDPILYKDVDRLRCTYDEVSAPYERRLGPREALYLMLVAEVFALDLRLPDRDYVVMAFEDTHRPDPYVIWSTGTGYLLNMLGPLGPLRMPYYGLTEYVEVGDEYERLGV
jgi:hypothetical protein